MVAMKQVKSVQIAALKVQTLGSLIDQSRTTSILETMENRSQMFDQSYIKSCAIPCRQQQAVRFQCRSAGPVVKTEDFIPVIRKKGVNQLEQGDGNGCQKEFDPVKRQKDSLMTTVKNFCWSYIASPIKNAQSGFQNAKNVLQYRGGHFVMQIISMLFIGLSLLYGENQWQCIFPIIVGFLYLAFFNDKLRWIHDKLRWNDYSKDMGMEEEAYNNGSRWLPIIILFLWFVAANAFHDSTSFYDPTSAQNVLVTGTVQFLVMLILQQYMYYYSPDATTSISADHERGLNQTPGNPLKTVSANVVNPVA